MYTCWKSRTVIQSSKSALTHSRKALPATEDSYDFPCASYSLTSPPFVIESFKHSYDHPHDMSTEPHDREPSPSARERALALPELLEAIIIQLPLQDILVNAQRINREWHVIVISQVVQQMLFFEPLSSSKPIYNPLLEKAFPTWFEAGAVRPYFRGKQFQQLQHAAKLEVIDAFARPEASWRRMLVLQPTDRTIIEVAHMHHSMSGKVRMETACDEFEGRARMGEIYDRTRDFVVKPRTKFLLQWFVIERRDG